MIFVDYYKRRANYKCNTKENCRKNNRKERFYSLVDNAQHTVWRWIWAFDRVGGSGKLDQKREVRAWDGERLSYRGHHDGLEP